MTETMNATAKGPPPKKKLPTSFEDVGMNRDEVAKLTDEQALMFAGSSGPAVIGQPLFDRAAVVLTHNPTGALGPMMFADETALRAAGKLPPKPGTVQRTRPVLPEPAAPATPDVAAAGVPVLTPEEQDAKDEAEREAKLALRRAANKQRRAAKGLATAPEVETGPAPVPPVARIGGEEMRELALADDLAGQKDEE